MNSVYWEGYDAYLDGKSSHENPYEYDTAHWHQWDKGYHAAANDD